MTEPAGTRLHPLPTAREATAAAGRFGAGWVIVGLGLAILVAVLPFAVGLLGAGVLYVVCVPGYRRLAPRIGRRTGAALVVAAALLLILVPGAVLVTVAMEQGPEIVRAIPQSQIFQSIASLQVGGIEVGAHVTAASGTLLTWLSQQALVVFGGIARTVLNLVISLFGLYYLLVARPGTWATVRAYLPFSAENSDLLRNRFHSVTEAALLGIALTALVQGTMIGLGFRLVGLPNALFWGMVTGIVSVLPVLGSAIVWFPAVIALLLESSYGMAALLAVIGGVGASNIDNVVRLVVFKRVSNIHPMITLVGAFAGVRYMGLLGVLLGPLAITYFFELLRVYRVEATGRINGADPAPNAVPEPAD